MTDNDAASLASRRALARQLDDLLIAPTPGRGTSGPRVSDLAQDPAVRRIRMALVDEALLVQPRTLERVMSFLADPATDTAARLAAEFDRQRSQE